MAVTTPICPRCKTNYFVRHDFTKPALGIISYYLCTACIISFVSKPEWKKMNQYMILRNPTTYENSSPKKFFDTLEQATTVAKKMAIEHRDTFYVIKLVRKVSLPEIVLNVEDL